MLIKSVFLAAEPQIWLMYSFHWYCPCATSACQKSQLFLQREPPSESEATQIFCLFVVQKLKLIALGAPCFIVDETKTPCQEGALPITIIITVFLACLYPKLHNHILSKSQKRKIISQWWQMEVMQLRDVPFRMKCYCNFLPFRLQRPITWFATLLERSPSS